MGQEQRLESEPQLDAFSLFLPLPYRVAVILVAGLLPVLYNPYSVATCQARSIE